MQQTEARRITVQMLVMLVLAAAPALATAWWHPRSPFTELLPEGALVDALAADEVTVKTALAWGDQVVWIDARPAEAYAAEHILGALHLGEGEWEQRFFEVLDAVPLDGSGRVVVYCGSEQCGASRAVADRLREEAGLEHVYVLHGGWGAWQAEHNP